MERNTYCATRPTFISVRRIIALFTLTAVFTMIFTISYTMKHRASTDKKTRHAVASHIPW